MQLINLDKLDEPLSLEKPPKVDWGDENDSEKKKEEASHANKKR